MIFVKLSQNCIKSPSKFALSHRFGQSKAYGMYEISLEISKRHQQQQSLNSGLVMNATFPFLIMIMQHVANKRQKNTLESAFISSIVY